MNGIKYRKPEEMKDSGVQWIGKMPNIWELSYIKYHSEINNGYPFNSDNFTFEQGFPIVRIRDIIRNKTETNYVGKIEKDALIDNDDILIGMDGDFNLNVWQGGKALLNQRILRIRGNKSLFDGFIKYILPYPLKVINDLTYYTTVKHLSNKDVMDIKFCLPDIIEQQKIANFLDIKTAQFDSIIAKKELLIKKLEEAKKSLISEVVTGKVKITNGEMVPREPDEMKDSGVEWLGMIPKNWTYGGFTKYLDSIVDYRGKTPEKVDKGIFLVTARNIKNGKIDYNLSSEFVRKDKYKEIMSRGIPQIGDVLFTTEAPLGEVANVDNTNIALAQRVVKFNGLRKIVNNYYLKYYISSSGFQQKLSTLATGSTALGIKASKFSQLEMLLPPYDEQSCLVEFLDENQLNIDKIIKKQISQIDKLKQAKQSLISEAVTGKIDLRDWEII